MLKIIESIYNIRFLDELASKKTLIHSLSPTVKLIVTLVYLVIILSIRKYDILGLIPYFFYPVIIFALAEIPFLEMLKRSLAALPFVIGMGIFNPFIDTNTYAVIAGVHISGGWISFSTLLIKCNLTVLAGLLLVATTGIEKIASAMRRLYFPKIFVTQILLTYRYISVLLEEAARVLKAYQLRAPMEKGVSFKVFGSLLGQMLLRAFDRSSRVYNSMVLRGFNGDYVFGTNSRLSSTSMVYLFLWITFFVLARIFNIAEVVGKIVMEVIK